MWPSLRRRQVVAGQRFRRDEESVVTLDRNEARQKSRRELAVSVTNDPHFGERCIERAHHRVARGPWNAEVPLFECANLAVGNWRSEHGLSLTFGAVERRRMEHVLPP